MDRSVQPSTSVNINDPDYSVRYDFHLLDPGPDDPSSVKGRRFFAPAAMVKHGREQLLQHPLTTKLLEEKWSTFGRIPYYVNFFTYILFVVAYSRFIILQRDRLSLSGSRVTKNSAYHHKILYILLRFVVLPIAFVHILKEILQLSIKRLKYLADVTNLVEWILFGTALNLSVFIQRYVWQIAIISIFLCYVNLVLFLRRFRSLGIYVIMYVEVTKTMLKVLLAFSVFILGFGIVFFVLFKEQVRATLGYMSTRQCFPLFSWTQAH